MNKNKFIFILVLLLSLTGCTHTRVPVYKMYDADLSAKQIQAEIRETERVIQEIQSKRGFSGRNVAMGLLFWPGILVNEMNGSDAIKVANQRMEILSKLYEKKLAEEQSQEKIT